MAQTGKKIKSATKPSVLAQQKKEKIESLIVENDVKNSEIINMLVDMKTQDKLNILRQIGVGSKYITCQYCGGLFIEEMFYGSTSPHNKTKKAHICKKCIEDVVFKKDAYGERQPATKQSVMEALELLDKPFISKLYDASIVESKMSEETKTSNNNRNVWASYIKNIAMHQYSMLRWRDGDLFKRAYKSVELGRVDVGLSEIDESVNDEILKAYEINKRDVIKFVGYDPFANYPREDEKPLLYANLCAYLDEETKNDGNKKNAAIQIVKKFNQAEKIDDQINMYINDIENATTNIPLVNRLADTSSKLMGIANKLAQDNGISVNHNNNKSKGANTLSGKIKKFNELKYRDAKINAFDIGTCEGMMQVAYISEKARHDQIGYDENIAQEIKDIKVSLVEEAVKERDVALERARRLLVENKDLKEFLKEKGLVNDKYEVI